MKEKEQIFVEYQLSADMFTLFVSLNYNSL